MMSLRMRAISGGVIWAGFVTVIGSLVLGGFIEKQAQTRFDETLMARHDRAIVALANSGGDPNQLALQLSDPAYQSPFSGHYWQIQNENGGEPLVSRSLTDALLSEIDGASDRRALGTISGPANQTLRSIAQPIILNDGDSWTVQVASSTESLVRDQNALRQRINLAKVFVSFFAILGALGIAIFTLRPLTHLRKDVTERWTNDGNLVTTKYPIEVQPLVSDINELLTRNRDIIGRSRRQAADLAHALKTPSAILRNELEGLKLEGVAINNSLDALDRLDAQLARSLARMRAEQGSAAEYSVTDIDASLGRMTRAFQAMAKNKDRSMHVMIDPSLSARINQDDFEEIIGNLLDNALKWSVSAISLSAFSMGRTIGVFIEDDGPGIPVEDRERVFSSGLRLDEAKPGTGLGLAIACELSRAYGGSIKIRDSSNLGGASFVVSLPLAGTK